MGVIYKYSLNFTEQSIEIAVGAKLLSASEQHGDIILWAMHDKSEHETERRIFHIVGTGQPFSDFNCEYFDTVFMENGLVWHIFFENKQ